MCGDMTEDLIKALRAGLNDAQRLVLSWPAWKRGVLEDSSRSTVTVPRVPLGKPTNEIEEAWARLRRARFTTPTNTGAWNTELVATYKRGSELWHRDLALVVGHILDLQHQRRTTNETP